MPADVTGHTLLDPATAQFTTRRGPVFTNLLLADEINRAPAKTQAALLEVMQEGQVTHRGHAASAGAAVHGAGDAEPDRAGRHLPAARGAARPLPAQDAHRLPERRGGRRDGAPRHATARSATGSNVEAVSTPGEALDRARAAGHRRGGRASTTRCSTTRCASCARRAPGRASPPAPGRAAASRWCARRAPRRCIGRPRLRDARRREARGAAGAAPPHRRSRRSWRSKATAPTRSCDALLEKVEAPRAVIPAARLLLARRAARRGGARRRPCTADALPLWPLVAAIARRARRGRCASWRGARCRADGRAHACPARCRSASATTSRCASRIRSAGDAHGDGVRPSLAARRGRGPAARASRCPPAAGPRCTTRSRPVERGEAAFGRAERAHALAARPLAAAHRRRRAADGARVSELRARSRASRCSPPTTACRRSACCSAAAAARASTSSSCASTARATSQRQIDWKATARSGAPRSRASTRTSATRPIAAAGRLRPAHDGEGRRSSRTSTTCSTPRCCSPTSRCARATPWACSP